VTDFKGGPFQLDSRETLASNELVHTALLNEMKQVFRGTDLEPLPDAHSFRR
jgi:hypothetical protein